MEVIAILAALAFAVNKTVTVIKAIGKDTNTVVTQVVVWVVGAAAIFTAGAADITADLVVPGLAQSLGDLDLASIILSGWMFGSSGSFAFDFKKALDNSDSAEEAPLLASGNYDVH